MTTKTANPYGRGAQEALDRVFEDYPGAARWHDAARAVEGK